MLRSFGKFELIKPLGRGAMGEVYLAKDPAIGREVAIKTIRKEVLLAPDARERFTREARAAGTLNHPNVVTVHELGEADDTLFLAMEYMEGKDLSAALRTQELSAGEILDVMAQVCDGLAYAHEKGILHRDIKPSNIRVSRTSGRLLAKIMDFGIAHLSGSDMTGTGMLLGTFGYMAPEYIQSGVPTPRTDLFAVGVMLHEAFAGERPFQGDTTATILYKVVNDHPRPLDASCFQGVSPKVQAVIRKALAKDPSKRFQAAGELADALRAAQDPAWSGLDAGAGDQPTQLGARTLAASAPPAAGGPITIIRTVAEPEAGGLPWGWIAAGGVTLLSVGLWVGRGQGAPPVLDKPGFAGPTAAQPGSGPGQAQPAQPPPPQASVPAPTAPVSPPLQGEPAANRPHAGPAPVDTEEDLERSAEGNPAHLLDRAERILAQRPGAPRALALKAVALYRLDRFRDLAGAFEEASQQGFHLPQLMRVPAFAEMVQAEQRDRRIPEAERERLPPPLGRDRGPDRGGDRPPRGPRPR